ncbi:MAG: leucine-rich repeat domain-containing protein, partial [Porticoccaceae bacterium]
MRIDLSVKHWLNIVCLLVLLPLSSLALSSYTKLDPPAALALIDENGHADIPDTYTVIGADAFKNSNLKSVTIPNSVTHIEDHAFYQAELTSITIPDSIISIGQEAFYNNDLSTVEIPDSVTHIKHYAFQSNNNLTTLTLGNA